MDIEGVAGERVMAYAEMVDLFGIEDKLPSEMLFRLSVFRPRFGPADLLDVFRATAVEFRGKNDVSPAARVSSFSSPASVKAASMFANKTYFSSDIIFRNLYRIMFLSSEWDSEILFQPDFIKDFCDFVSELKPRREGYDPGSAPFDSRALDLYETLLEFKDKLIDKVKTASGA